ncbi:MAG: hypothetical protein PHH54_02985 [Candidatus Nanoarchaeia archaeon]|nr:hypothetical protein [Candidatus Nanoarchaeia archaeon]
MKKNWICSLVLIISSLVISFVSGQIINLNYSQEVNYGEEFNVNIILSNFSQDTYDIKIDILSGSNRLSKIWDGNSWQSTNFYVNDIINTSNSNEKTFRLNITENYNGSADIEVKIKDSKNNIKSFSGYQININPRVYNPSQNNTQQNNTNDTQNTSISLSIGWNEDDIINGEEFSIDISAEDLEDEEYDIMVWIEDEDGNVINDRYGKDSSEEEVWISGSRYIYNFFQGPGDETNEIKLRMRSSYSDFSGDAEIIAKIRESGTSSVIDEVREDIEVLEKEEEDTSNTKEKERVNDSKNAGTSTKLTPSISTSPVSGDIIKLGNSESIEGAETAENQEGSVIYESKNGKIKLYALFGFSLVCLILVILLVLNKIK